MTEALVQKIARAYELDVESVLPMQSGYRNQNYPLKLSNGAIVNLVLYKREPNMVETIRLANRLGDFLHANGFPARYCYDPRIIRVFAPPHEQFAALYAYLPGVTIPWEAYTMAHLKALGKTMSDMHSLLDLRKIPAPPELFRPAKTDFSIVDVPTGTLQPDKMSFSSPEASSVRDGALRKSSLAAQQPRGGLMSVAEVYGKIISRMYDYFDDRNVRSSVAHKLNIVFEQDIFDEFRQLMQISDYLPAQQPLHMDFVRSNILFAPDHAEITGVLDFEKALYGAPVFDIARTLAFLLVDCKYKTEAQIRKYFLKSGYCKYGGATFGSVIVKSGRRSGSSGMNRLDVLEEAINMFLFYDFYKFLRHNPYEFLWQNEHYARTTNLLVDRGVIKRL